MYIFGGQDDDNQKLDDLWAFNLEQREWSPIKFGDDDFKPVARSGHSTVVYGNKMYIFGGILELTKELNDLVVFNFDTKKFSSNDAAIAKDQSGNASTTKVNGNAADNSPKLKKEQSIKRKTGGMSPTRSPVKKRTLTSPARTMKDGPETHDVKHEKLASPTSVTMQNSFIIKNADESFDAYWHQMTRKKKGHHNTNETSGH
jgi:hypothetical protein